LLYGVGGTNGVEVGETFWEPPRDPNTAKIPDGKRHNELVAYAVRLRGKDLDYREAEFLFGQRWLLCEQPEGQIPEAAYHSATCRYPVTWDEAQVKLRSVFSLSPPGQGKPPPSCDERSWRAVDLEAVLSGHWEAPKPTVGQRSDGVGLFYPGKVHT